jgi:hypothetical protein
MTSVEFGFVQKNPTASDGTAESIHEKVHTEYGVKKFLLLKWGLAE